VKRVRLALRLLTRDWRAGELRLFVIAIVIAVGAVTAVGFFNDRLDRGLGRRSADLLGADMILRSSAPVTPSWLEAAARYSVKTIAIVDFDSVVVRGERLQLSSVRAAAAGYPPRGSVRTAVALYQPGAPTGEIPAPGTAWAEARLFQALSIDVGETIEIGNARFRLTRVLTTEPGFAGRFFSFGPRILINIADVPRTGVVQPGSRVSYRYGFAGAETQIERLRAWLAPRLGAADRLIDAHQGNSRTSRVIERVYSYFGLTSLLAVMLAGVAIAMAARRYSLRHYDTSAMLRALGATQRDIVAIYLPQFFVLGLAGSALGCLVGFAVQHGIYYVLKELFPTPLPSPGLAPVALGFGTGVVTLAGFALVPVLRLRAVSPLRVLRRELAPLPASAWAVLLAAAAALFALVWYYTRNWTLTFGVLAGGGVAISVLLASTMGMLRVASGLKGRRFGLWRQGLNRLQRTARASAGQILAFGLVFMAMTIIGTARTDLLASWRAQIPDDAPNHFVFNVLPKDVVRMQRFFQTHAIASKALYPLVRGRLTAINGVPAREAVTKDAGADNAALRRDLNFTWTDELAPDNRIVRGAWWGSAPAKGLVSVEERLAQRLGVEVGDRLTFTIAAQTLDARVASIRKVQWESFRPNFFMIFSPGTLDGFPATYMTSFRIASTQKPLLATLVRAFPSATVLELDQLLDQIRAILGQASLAVELVLLFVLAGGLSVLYAALAASLDERFYEGAILRTFGASRRQLRRAQFAEFATLGLFAGIMAAIGAEVAAYVLYSHVFDIVYAPKWWVWVIVPVAGAGLIGLAGFIGTRGVVARSPLSVLRET
jgi:putative ABC transport system permease protein